MNGWRAALFSDSMRFLVYIFYCIEGGLFLMLLPWSRLWPRNYFFVRLPMLEDIALHPATRGLVSGLGLALMIHGVHEVVMATSTSRRRAREDREAQDADTHPTPSSTP